MGKRIGEVKSLLMVW